MGGLGARMGQTLMRTHTPSYLQAQLCVKNGEKPKQGGHRSFSQWRREVGPTLQ